MNWAYRIVVIVPASARSAAEQLARDIDPYGPDYDGDGFTTPLSADGVSPATHWAVYTSATDEMVAAMAAALPQVEGAMFWRHGVDGLLQASNVTDAAGQQWGWSESLAAAGLKQIEPLP